MNKLLLNTYRVVVPKPVRTEIVKKILRLKILKYFSRLPENEVNEEQREVLSYLKSNPLVIFPYSFRNNYNSDKIEVFLDSKLNMPYVMFDASRLYFKKRLRTRRIQRSFAELLMEQDIDSPHRYLSDGFDITESDVIADIGAAEGNFSLSVVKKVKKIYIFEYNRRWAEALRVTFAPWKEKVEIINKEVADFDDETHIRFDSFLKDHEDITFMKIDVDGAEQKVLNSCRSVFEVKCAMKIALCTYHRNNDEKDFTSFLMDHGFKVVPSKGYMIMLFDKQIKAPYLRRGIIRAIRN